MIQQYHLTQHLGFKGNIATINAGGEFLHIFLTLSKGPNILSYLKISDAV